MNGLRTIWANFIFPNSTLILIVVQLVINLYFFYRLRKLTQQNKKLNRESFTGIYITIAILIIFAMFAIGYLKVNFDSFKKAAEGFLTDPLTASIANMQTATLAISSLVVTLASIIIAILTLYRDRKTELNNIAIEESLNILSMADAELQTLSSIISIQFIDERQRECYHDAIVQYLESIEFQKDDNLYNRFIVTQLSIMNGMAQIEKNSNEQLNQYLKIAEIAENVINCKNTTLLDKQFSALELLHALYHVIKLKIDISPNSANYDIERAMRYLRNRYLYSYDSFGHIANTKGLIHLWSGIAKARMKEKERAVLFFKESLLFFNEALSINPNRKEFLNHKGVALQQLFDVKPNDRLKSELKRTLKLISSLSPQYGKGQLNYASFMVRELRNKLSLQPLDMFPDYKTKIPVEYDFAELFKYALDAKRRLELAKELCPLMINCDYKMGELLTLIIMMKRDKCIKYDNEVVEAEKSFKNAAEKNEEHLSFLYCKYAFHTLRDETKEEAKGIKAFIKERTKIS